MDNSEKPAPKEPNPMVTFFWFLIGITPIPIFLIITGQDAIPGWLNFPSILGICFVCNVLGGIGCLRRVKKGDLRVVYGTLLGLVFFGICAVVALFVACSNMRID